MLSIVLPTYNEAQNLPIVLPAIEKALKGVPHEVIIVDDDSPDRTWEAAEKLKTHYPHLRVIRRVGKRGLSSAVTDGFAQAKGDVLGVMDGDGQHDSSLIRSLHDAIAAGADIAVGSRYMPGGSVGDWVRDRRIISKAGTKLSQLVSSVRVSDPLGGFFLIRRRTYDAALPTLRPTGFKILLEILANVPRGAKVKEIPLVFKARTFGRSKLNWRVHLQFIGQILRLGLRRFSGAWKFQAVLFGLVVAGSAAMLLPRIWSLRALYLDADLRERVRVAMTEITRDEGWLLSDTSVVAVTENEIVFDRRYHHRGEDETSRCTMSITTREHRCDAR